MTAKLFHFLKAFATKITFETPGYFLLCHIPAFTHLPALGVEHLHPFNWTSCLLCAPSGGG